MKTRYLVLGLAGVGLLTLPLAPAALAQAGKYPEKPVTIIADAAPGATRTSTRVRRRGLGRIWGQQVIVVNQPGANGSIAARAATEAPADGYTLYMPALSTFVALPTVAPNLPLKCRAISCRSASPRKSRCSSRSPRRSASRPCRN